MRQLELILGAGMVFAVPKPMPDVDWIQRRRLAYNFARHWGCRPDEAEDIAQQALLLAWTAPTAINEGWLYVVTRRLVVRMRLRSQRETPPVPKQELGFNANIESRILFHEITGLRVLNVADRILLDHIVAGRSHSEIGALCGYGASSVGVRLQRLARKIRHTVEGSAKGVDNSLDAGRP